MRSNECGILEHVVREAAYPHTMGCGTGRRARDLAGRWMRYGKVAQDMDRTSSVDRAYKAVQSVQRQYRVLMADLHPAADF